MLDTKLYFHQRVSYTTSQALEFLVLISFPPNNLYSLDRLQVLSVAFITLSLENDFLARKKFTQVDTNKFANIKINFQT
jgi:hypothetical protein